MKEAFKAYLADDSKLNLNELSFDFEANLARTELVKLLNVQNENASSLVQENIKRLENETSFVVLTGQQLGLMGGPLYTIYKILNTVKLCKSLEKVHKGKQFIPVFWMEGEDADFEEVSKLNYYRNGELREFVYKDEENRSIAKRELGIDINRLSMTLGFEQTFEAERNWLEAFYLYFKPVFDEYGIIAFHSNRRDVKEKSDAFVKKLLQNYEAFRKAIFSRTTELEQEGFRIQVPIKDEESFIFSHEETERRKLTLDEARHVSPMKFSPNVLLRPIYQDWIFPTVAYVAGNAEISYQMQLSNAYKFFGRSQPMLFPRSHHVLITPKMKRLLKKYAFDGNYDLESFKNWKEAVLRSEKHDDLDQMNQSFEEQIQSYFKTLAKLDFTDRKTKMRILQSAEKKITKNLEQLSRKLSNILKRQDTDKIAHLDYLEKMLFPKGKLQERFYSVSQFDRNLLPFAKDVIEQMDLFDFNLQKIELR